MTLGKRAIEITENIEKAIKRKLSEEEKKILWSKKLTNTQIKIATDFLSQNWIPKDFILGKLSKVLDMTKGNFKPYVRNPILIHATIRDSEFQKELKKEFPISEIEKWFTKEISLEDVQDYEREDLRALSSKQQYILIDVSDFLKKKGIIPFKIPEEIMTRILTFFEDNGGNYANCTLFIRGTLPEKEIRKLKRKALKVVKVS